MASKRVFINIGTALRDDFGVGQKLIEYNAKCTPFMCGHCNVNVEYVTAVEGDLFSGFSHKSYEDGFHTVGFDLPRYKKASLCWGCFVKLDGLRINPQFDSSPLMFIPKVVIPMTTEQGGRTVAKTSMPVREITERRTNTIPIEELMKYPREQWEFILKEAVVYPTKLRSGDATPRVEKVEVVRTLPSHSKAAKKTLATFKELKDL